MPPDPQPPGIAPARLLDLWERGNGMSPIERALLLAGTLLDGAAARPVGMRDAALLRLRRSLFGDRIDGRATCHACGEELEFTLSAEALLGIGHAGSADPLALEHGGARFRVPTSADILAAIEAGDADGDALLDRCIVDATGSVNEDLRAAVAGAIAAADPLADVTIALACPACGERADVAFDIGTLLWTELDAWSRRTLAEVHVLARAYGWTEPDVLALGPRRRALYLEMAAAR